MEERDPAAGSPGSGEDLGPRVSRRRAALLGLLFSYGGFALVLVRNIALVPIYLRHIGSEEYGSWLATGAVLVQLTALDLGLTAVLSQRVAASYGARDRDEMERLAGSGILAVVLLATLAVFVTAALAPVAPGLIGSTGEMAERLTGSFFIVAAANGIRVLGLGAAGVLRALQRTDFVAANEILAELVAIATTLWLVLSGWGLHGIAIGILARNLVNAAGTYLGSTWLFRRQLGLRPRWSRATAGSLVRASGVVFTTQIAARLKMTFDPFLVGIVLGGQAAGVYALTLRAHETVRSFAHILAGVLSPGVAHLHGEGDRARFRDIVIASYKVQALVGAVGLGGVIAFNEGFVRLWVGSELYGGRGLSILGGFASLAYLVVTVAYDALWARGEFRTLLRFAWLDVLVRVPLILLLLSAVGFWGAPVASITAQVLAFGVPLTFILLQRIEMPAGDARRLATSLAKLVGPVVALALVAESVLAPAGSWLELALQAGAFVVVSLALVAVFDRPLVRFFLTRGRGSALGGRD